MTSTISQRCSRVEQKETSGLENFQDHRGCSEANEEHPTPCQPFDLTVLPALTYASETWSLREQDKRSLSVIERAVGRTMVGVSCFSQVRDEIRGSDLRLRSKIKDAVLYAKQSKIRRAGHAMRMKDNRWKRAVSGWILRDVKRTAGRSSSTWSEFFAKSLAERYDAQLQISPSESPYIAKLYRKPSSEETLVHHLPSHSSHTRRALLRNISRITNSVCTRREQRKVSQNFAWEKGIFNGYESNVTTLEEKSKTQARRTLEAFRINSENPEINGREERLIITLDIGQYKPHSPDPEIALNFAALGRKSTERLLKYQDQWKLPGLQRTMVTICTYNARTLAPESSIEDMLMQARRIRHDVIDLLDTRRRQPFNAVCDTGKELFLGKRGSRGVWGVGVLINTSLSINIDLFEQLTTRIGRLRLKACGSILASTIFVVYVPTSNNEEGVVEAFYMDLEKFNREDHTVFKTINGDFNAKIGRRRSEVTLEPTDLSGTKGVSGYLCLSWRPRQFMVTRNSRTPTLSAGSASLPMESIENILHKYWNVLYVEQLQPYAFYNTYLFVIVIHLSLHIR
ncbi:unnamed protein product [Angiostrongylus costaricensis]|uniref:Reverse transcriptase domain-containing protein n=1 Tax=Angiostrongylus costaricensis TaxID=334426 RepID=A0A0R3PX78_ANGCS|nr:unnamed protein product [Angiostrongylus costaricensis]